MDRGALEVPGRFELRVRLRSSLEVCLWAMTLARCIGIVTPLVLALAIASAGLLSGSERLSAGLTLGWLVLSIGQQALTSQRANRLWPVALLVILLLNVRGVVLGEGPRPVSHMDYVVLIAAVMAGESQSLQRWRSTLSCICFSVASCGLWQATTVWYHLTGTEIGYRFGFLLVNQTALLAGLGCLSGWAALKLWRNANEFTRSDAARDNTPANRLVHLALLMGTGGCAVMALATHSRAGAGLIPISLLVAWTIQQGMQYRRDILHWLWRRWLTLALIAALLLGTPMLWLASPQGPALRQGISSVYGRENRTSDLGRIELWRCYFSLPFSGSNRFLYGVGYESARQMCPIRLQLPRQRNLMKPMSHAHNLPLQIWAESGSLGFVMVLVGALLLARRVFSHQLKPQAMAISVPLIYSLLFNLFELGMFKVPLLMVLFGTMLSGALIKPTSGAGKRLPADGIAIAKAVVP